MVLARGITGEVVTYPVAENIHQKGILDVSIVPARVDDAIRRQAIDVATRIAEKLDYIGVMAVEFFVSAGFRQIEVTDIAAGRSLITGKICSRGCPRSFEKDSDSSVFSICRVYHLQLNILSNLRRFFRVGFFSA